MKALSLWQPWASLIAHGLKRVETRSWATSYRGPILVHAAKRFGGEQRAALFDLEQPSRFRAELVRAGLPMWDELPLGAVVAVARAVSCVEMTPELIDLAGKTPLELAVGDWKPGRFAWALEDVRALPEPVPCLGAQGLWEVRRVQAAGCLAYPKRLARELHEADYDRLRAIYDEVARG